MQEQLSEAISDQVDHLGLSTVEIRKLYRSVRAGHLRRLRGDEAEEVEEVKNVHVPRRDSVRHRPGLRMLCSLAEVTGLRVSLKIEGAAS